MAKRKPGRPRRIPAPTEAARCLAVSESAMRRAIYQHDIPVLRFGRVMRLSQAVVQRILAAGEFEAGRLSGDSIAGDGRVITCAGGSA